jgi:hypothetical protein
LWWQSLLLIGLTLSQPHKVGVKEKERALRLRVVRVCV